MTGQPQVESASHRAVLAVVVVLATLSGSLLFHALGVLGPLFSDELGIARLLLGVLASVVVLAAAVASRWAGHLVDRFGSRPTLCGLFALAAIATVGLALSPSATWMMVPLGVSGVSLALTQPATNRLIVEIVPAGSRTWAMGVKQSGIMLGALAVGAFLPSTASAIGWRAALGLYVVLPLSGLAVVLFGVAVPTSGGATTERGNGDRGALPSRPTGDVRRLARYTFLMAFGLAASGVYLPLYGAEVFAMNARSAGYLIAALSGTAIVARFVWAHLGERRFHSAGILAVVAALASISQSGYIIAESPARSVVLLWVSVVSYGATAAAWQALSMLTLLDRVDAPSVGRASGVVQGAFYVAFVASPVAFSALVERSGSYRLAWLMTAMSFAAAAVVALRWWRSEGAGGLRTSQRGSGPMRRGSQGC